jgi:phospholipid/cholesterol/gamma-HCH transport system permease protein
MIDGKSETAAGLDLPLPWLGTILAFPPVRASKNLIYGFLEWFGELAIFFWRVVRAAVTPPFEFRELFRQLDEIGSKSLPVVALAGGAIGVVLSLEARHSLTRFGAKSLLPAAVVFAVIDESGPIITGLVASGRLGAGIGAELASMKVTEQIDAIEASAVNPYRLLAAPRILACILMLPLLTLAADFCGLAMGWVTQTLAEPVTFSRFINDGFRGATFNDLLPPAFKTAVFGLIIGLIACFQGMRTRGGAEGVGRAATSSVVLSSLFVIVADVVLVKLILIFFP